MSDPAQVKTMGQAIDKRLQENSAQLNLIGTAKDMIKAL
jgi:hypothetical protein